MQSFKPFKSKENLIKFYLLCLDINQFYCNKEITRCSPSKFVGKYFNFVWFMVCEFRHDSI